jgi:hypothetical protein
MFVLIPQSRVDNSCSLNLSSIIITGLTGLVKSVFAEFAKKGENGDNK